MKYNAICPSNWDSSCPHKIGDTSDHTDHTVSCCHTPRVIHNHNKHLSREDRQVGRMKLK